MLFRSAGITNIVHDEMSVYVHKSQAEALKKDLNDLWQKNMDILRVGDKSVPVNGDWNAGQTWYDAK